MKWKDVKNIRGLRSIGALGSSNIIGSTITAVFWILIAGLIGTDSYGELSYFLAIIGISSVIVNYGGGYAMQVYTAKGVKIESSLYFLGIITSTVAGIILFLIFENFGVSISVVGIVAFNFILFETLGKKLYKKYFKIFVAQKILFVISASTFYFAFGPEGILVGYGVSMLLFSQIIYKSFKNNKVDFLIIKERAKFLSHIYLADLSATARNHIDKVISWHLKNFNFDIVVPCLKFKYIDTPHIVKIVKSSSSLSFAEFSLISFDILFNSSSILELKLLFIIIFAPSIPSSSLSLSKLSDNPSVNI